MHLFRDAGDAGGDAAAVQDPPVGKEPDKAGGADAAGEGLPTTVEEWQKHHETFKTESEKKLSEVQSKLDSSTLTVGRQGNDLSGYNTIKQAMEKDPKGLAQRIAEGAGLKIKFEDDSLDEIANMLTKFQQGDGDAKELAGAFMSKVHSTADQAAMKKLEPAIEKILNNALADKYGDEWAKHEVARGSFEPALNAGDMTPMELYQLAAMGRTSSETLKQVAKDERAAGFKEGAEAKEKEISEKLRNPGGGGAQIIPQPTKKENSELLGNALTALKQQGRG